MLIGVFQYQCSVEKQLKDDFVATLYIDGDKDAGHPRVFLDERGRALNKYAHGSKVLDRLAARTGFLFKMRKINA